ncbi:MAG: nucleotidyltransferase family protein [Opitutales bacterium]|nr:nucleotidyltransferase family protein [Opitutales bacterium]
MSRKKKFLEIVRNESELLKAHGVKEIGIFGSVSREEDIGRSDYDVLIVFEEGKKSFRNFVAISDLLEEKLGAPVDLVTREGLSPHIGPHILKEAEYVPVAP